MTATSNICSQNGLVQACGVNIFYEIICLNNADCTVLFDFRESILVDIPILEIEINRDRCANIAEHINVELFPDRNSVFMRLFAPFFGPFSWMIGLKSAEPK